MLVKMKGSDKQLDKLLKRFLSKEINVTISPLIGKKKSKCKRKRCSLSPEPENYKKS